MKKPKLRKQFIWESPPVPDVVIDIDWDKELKPLRQNTGQWARILDGHPIAVNSIYQRLILHLDDDYELIVASIDATSSGLWGRYTQ